MSLYPFVPHEISVLAELTLEHLRYHLIDVPPQPNSPSDTVFNPDRPTLSLNNRGTDSPMSNCCSHGTFLHFSLSSHLNICYYHQDLHQQRFDLGSRLRLQHHRCALLHVGPASSARRQGVGATLERHPFSGLVDSAGELLHTP